ncbi:unnamed protein product, partial [Laminaria digitata]
EASPKLSARDRGCIRHKGTRRPDEKVELAVRDSRNGWHTLVGYSSNKHGLVELKGYVKPNGDVFVYRAEDVYDDGDDPSSAERKGRDGKKQRGASRHRKKLTTANTV